MAIMQYPDEIDELVLTILKYELFLIERLTKSSFTDIKVKKNKVNFYLILVFKFILYFLIK